MNEIRRHHLTSAVRALAMLSAVALVAGDATATLAPSPSVTVTVVDRSSGDTLPAVSVRVTQVGRAPRPGITGANGSVTIDGVTPGDATVLCEKDGFQRKPQDKQAILGTGNTPVRMTLISETRDRGYFRKAGQSIEAEGRSLPATLQQQFYVREWERIKQLRPEYRIEIASELKLGQPFLIKDSLFLSAIQQVPPG
jgi:hypothetical protein